MSINIKTMWLPLALASWVSCKSNDHKQTGDETSKGKHVNELLPLKPDHITERVVYDTDDPAIWLNPEDIHKSLIIGTDKEEGGGIYAFDLFGKMVNKVTGLKRPNNVDVAYRLPYKGGKLDIAVFTERKANTIRVCSLPDLKPVDNGGIPVFEGETCEECRDAMGIALYTPSDGKIYAIVGRKNGPDGTYLWQYVLKAGNDGIVKAELVRKFGKYSGKKEIEAIAVDNELGYVYYSDEQVGVRKYYADPSKGNDELALFATEGFTEDHEGISIYKRPDGTGYILVSDQSDSSFMIYPRAGADTDPHQHELITKIKVSTTQSDGSDVTSTPIGNMFPYGFFVAMSEGKVFQIYDWRYFQERIDKAAGVKQAK